MSSDIVMYVAIFVSASASMYLAVTALRARFHSVHRVAAHSEALEARLRSMHASWRHA